MGALLLQGHSSEIQAGNKNVRLLNQCSCSLWNKYYFLSCRIAYNIATSQVNRKPKLSNLWTLGCHRLCQPTLKLRVQHPSPAITPQHTTPPGARRGSSMLPPLGRSPREAEESLFFNSGGPGIRFIFLLKPLPHVQTSCTGWCNLRAKLKEEVIHQQRTQNKGSISKLQAATKQGLFT